MVDEHLLLHVVNYMQRKKERVKEREREKSGVYQLAMTAALMFPPEDQNNYKVYEIVKHIKIPEVEAENKTPISKKDVHSEEMKWIFKNESIEEVNSILCYYPATQGCGSRKSSKQIKKQKRLVEGPLFCLLLNGPLAERPLKVLSFVLGEISKKELKFKRLQDRV
ncbi:hypothetical protein TREES_T100019694 [Tupaia chinensis]|uniref:Uncharacterized protein n=1 Tax=Tupaia chinensis TaxID=246437 RepID=L9JIP7_TUPCH|nr:hypothetical protein TREES_T100019694 [Tupaia chinensis]